MPKLELMYFDVHGGRGEVARWALFIAGIPFEDKRIPGANWASVKPSTPFGAMPVLKIDGKEISQSNAIIRYVGKLGKLYPDDALQAAYCDEIMDAVEDIAVPIGRTLSIKDEAEKKARRQELADGPIRFYLER